MNKVKFLFIWVSALLSSYAHAGLVIDGPFVIWVNLSQQPSPVDHKIRSFLNSGKARCWPEEALIFMVSKPKAITPDLVNRALIKRETAAIRRLNVLMKRPYGEAHDGFDGIVAYHDKPSAIMYSLTTGHRKIEESKIDLALDPDDVEGSFCAVVPEISRGP
jgi:hypothetical protein